MGQSASKGLNKAAGKVAKRAPFIKSPPLPSRAPQASPPSSEIPENFLRGTGIAAQDVRDRGQEMFLQHERQRHKFKDSKAAHSPVASTPDSDTISSSNTDMPDDLLKFIQDVGPANKSIDREFTNTRLLKEENREELVKAESVRTAKRKRVRMPLIQGEDNFTTEKNTNFSVENGSISGLSSETYDFGLSNLQLYEFLTQKIEGEEERIVSKFHEQVLANNEKKNLPDHPSSKGEELKKKHLQLLSQTLKVLEVPTLRINADGDILGLHAKDVPGPEITSIRSIPENKAVLVLKDLSTKDSSIEKGYRERN